MACHGKRHHSATLLQDATLVSGLGFSGLWRESRRSVISGLFFRARYSCGMLRELNLCSGNRTLLVFSQGGHARGSDLTVLEGAHAADTQATHDHTIDLQRHTAFGRDHAGEG